MMTQIQEQHRQKLAYVYLRQSTYGQVLHHRESTERQYDLYDKALAMGWPRERIRTFDGDLASSAKPLSEREDFKAMMFDVSMKRVGAIFALECSRLARSNAEWHSLLQVCALSDTLLIDDDGCYHPVEFNDQLVLTFKGAMSHAELHMMHLRLHGGKAHKAGKGILRFALPAGYRFDRQDRIVKDPDEQVREAVGHFFDAFRKVRSAYGVVVQFHEEGRLFPKRAYGGARDGRLSWGPLNLRRALDMLRHPCYAGAYAWGRSHTTQTLSDEGQVCQRVERLPVDQWPVLIPDHHPGYVSWDVWEANCRIVDGNARRAKDDCAGSAPREGRALLQGLVYCMRCGRRLRTFHQGTGGRYASYVCEGQRPDALARRTCRVSLSAAVADPVVERRALARLEPAQVQLAAQAWAELERRQAAQERQWELRVEAARHDAELAHQRYEEVDPKRRLVADSLEQAWEDALARLREAEAQRAAHRQAQPRGLDAEQKRRLTALAEDLPQLWSAPSTRAKDKKQILRLLVKDVFVERDTSPGGGAVLHVRWHGGTSEDLPVEPPLMRCDRTRYGADMIAEVRELARTRTDRQVAEHLNEQGRLSITGKPFSGKMINWVRRQHDIPGPNPKGENELTVREVAERFGIKMDMVYYWIEQGWLPARRQHPHRAWRIVLSPEKEEELWQRIRNSRMLGR